MMHSKSKKTFPINELAPELISEIFLHCHWSFHGQWPPWTFRRGHGRPFSLIPKSTVADHPPLVFGRVCSKWRVISLSTPALWAQLQLSEEISPKGFDKNFVALPVFLERSGSYPLDLYFPVDHERRHSLGDKWHASLNRLIPMILPHSRRWRIISGVFNQPCVKMILSRFPNVPLLEMLEIQVRGNYDRELITIDLSEPLPLSTLCLIDSPTHFRFSGVIQNNLWNLGGRHGTLYLTLNDCFQCLVHCPFIEEFKVVTVDHLHTTFDIAMIELPNIVRFEISCQRGGDISSLFDALYLPAMEDFEFLSSSAPTPLQCPWSSIARMLPQSPKLRFLTIHTVPVVVEDLAKCLANTPGLQYLDLQNILNGNAIISLLTLHRLSGGMVDGLTPKLKRILLNFTSHTDQISTTAVAEMILSRCQSDADDTYVDESTVGGAHSHTGTHPNSQRTLGDVRLGSISEFTAESLTTQFPELVGTRVEIMIVNDTRNCGRLLFL